MPAMPSHTSPHCRGIAIPQRILAVSNLPYLAPHLRGTHRPSHAGLRLSGRNFKSGWEPKASPKGLVLCVLGVRAHV
jgi:hypothetical protein